MKNIYSARFPWFLISRGSTKCWWMTQEEHINFSLYFFSSVGFTFVFLLSTNSMLPLISSSRFISPLFSADFGGHGYINYCTSLVASRLWCVPNLTWSEEPKEQIYGGTAEYSLGPRQHIQSHRWLSIISWQSIFIISNLKCVDRYCIGSISKYLQKKKKKIRKKCQFYFSILMNTVD